MGAARDAANQQGGKIKFVVWGFAGNSAIDHGDRLHALPYFVNRRLKVK